MGKYLYKVYGLVVESEVQLKELIEVINEDVQLIDVKIKFEDTPSIIKEKIISGKTSKFNINDGWFCIKDVAIYYIRDGNNIIIEKDGGNDQDIKTFLLGSAFGALLIQRGTVAIHGGTVVLRDRSEKGNINNTISSNEKSIIITGDMGVGKSTLTSAFRLQGYKFLSDDVSVIGRSPIKSYDGNELKYITVEAAYPQQKLCRDALLKLGYNVEDFDRIDESRDKFAIPSKNHFISEARRVNAICEVIVGESEESSVKIEEVVGLEKIKNIMKNIYRIEIARIVGIQPTYFNEILEISKEIKYYKVIRPKNKFTVNEQIKAICKVTTSD